MNVVALCAVCLYERTTIFTMKDMKDMKKKFYELHASSNLFL
jgi:hypothetical protein